MCWPLPEEDLSLSLCRTYVEADDHGIYFLVIKTWPTGKTKLETSTFVTLFTKIYHNR